MNSATHDSTTLTSQTSSKYSILAELGRGGMATAYLAAMQGAGGFNKLVVIKRLRPALAAEQEFLQMFLEEARLSARIDHPNVVHTTEVGFDGKYHYIAMEYLEGQSLDSVFRRLYKRRKEVSSSEITDDLSGEAELPLKLHLLVVSQVLLGLHSAHELTDFDGSPLNVVHRDVSPHNIVVTYDGYVKLLDFGIAKAADSSGETRTGVMKGKCAYMPIEQFGGKAIDRRADVFAVGVILWQALTGRRLWRGLSDGEIFQKVALGDIPPPRSVRPEISSELEAICMKALALRAEDRFATAADFQMAIDDYVAVHAELRTSSRELGKFLVDHFADDRAKLKGIIEAQLGKAATSRSLNIPLLGERASVSVSGANMISEGHEPDGALPKPRRALVFGAGSIAILAIAVAAWAGLSRGRHTTVVLTNTPATTSIASGSSSVATIATAGTTLYVSCDPANAALTFDDAPLEGNPSVTSFRRDGVSHKIQASASGYVTKAEWVVLDKPEIHLALVLEAKRPSESRAAAQRNSASPVRTAKKADDPAPPVAPPPVLVVASSPTTPPPPAPPSAATVRGPQLDKSDPWAPGK